MTESSAVLSFDLAEATQYLAERDEHLKHLIEETTPFQLKIEAAQSPYETLVEAIAYQSISGKAAATIYGRVKALSATGRAPTPQEMLKLRKPVLRKAGLSGAKILAMKDLAQKTLDGVVPTLEQAEKLPSPTAKSTCLNRKNSSPLANAGALTAPSQAGTCGVPASLPAAPPCAKSAPHDDASVAHPNPLGEVDSVNARGNRPADGGFLLTGPRIPSRNELRLPCDARPRLRDPDSPLPYGAEFAFSEVLPHP